MAATNGPRGPEGDYPERRYVRDHSADTLPLTTIVRAAGIAALGVAMLVFARAGRVGPADQRRMRASTSGPNSSQRFSTKRPT